MSQGTKRFDRPRIRRRRWLTLRSPRRRHLSVGEVVIASSILAAAIVTFVIFHRQGSTQTADAELLLMGGDIRLETKTFADGRAHFYRLETGGGREIRFFVIKASDGVPHAAFDACELCYKEHRGFRQSGHTMVCNACGRVFPVARVDQGRGDCHPISLERDVQGQHVLIKAAAILKGARYF